MAGRASRLASDRGSAASTHTNRLAQESSPYLRLHMHNPVDWYPWGPEHSTRHAAKTK